MKKIMKQTRLFLVWTLASLLSFQPAALAAGQANTMDDLKSYLEKTNISQKSQNFKEFVRTKENLISPQLYARLMEVAEDYPEAMIPKVDVTKIQGPHGEEQLQFSATMNGKAASAVVVADKKVFIKVNGKTITPYEMQNAEIYFKKVGFSEDMVQQYFSKRTVASDKMGILSAEQINKLPTKERKIYFKQFRQLLESIEAVQQMKAESKSTSLERSFEKFALQAILGELAEATPGESCVAAGHVTITGISTRTVKAGDYCKGVKVQVDTNCTSESCGTGSDGKLIPSLRGECGERQFQCNTLVYGDRKLCADAGRSTTSECNDKANTGDIPSIASLKDAGAKAEFARLQASAKEQAIYGMNTCGNLQRHAKGLREDQMETCDKLSKRLETITSWTCDKTKNPSFASTYPKICPKDPAHLENPEVPGADPGQNGGGQADKPPGTPIPDGVVYCDHLPPNKVLVSDPNSGKMKDTCQKAKGAAVFNAPEGCQDSKGKAQPVYVCNCDGGAEVSAKMTCPAGNGKDVAGTDDKDPKKKKKKENNENNEKKDGPPWLLIGGVGLLGLLAFHWMAKSSQNDFYKKLEPVPPNPVVPPPVAPAPRTTQ
jgi:hypothetical protein